MKTAKLLQFPKNGLTGTNPNVTSEVGRIQKATINTHKLTGWKKIVSWLLGLLWLFLALLWPLINWLGAMDVVFQFVRALYYANTPANHATVQALIHSALYLCLSFFVYLYRPKVF
jgi:hypothetical protein